MQKAQEQQQKAIAELLVAYESTLRNEHIGYWTAIKDFVSSSDFAYWVGLASTLVLDRCECVITDNGMHQVHVGFSVEQSNKAKQMMVLTYKAQSVYAFPVVRLEDRHLPYRRINSLSKYRIALEKVVLRHLAYYVESQIEIALRHLA